MMYKQKMIENEKDFDCQMKHQQPISMVILDPQLKSNQRLLCQKCIDDFETQTRTMGLKRAIQMIEDNRKLQMEFLGNLITQNIKNIELFQSKLFDLQSYLVQQLDQMIDITKDWIQNLQSACQKFSEYSFFEELDSIIMNNKSSQIDQNNFSNQIKLLNEAWNIKLNSKLELFKSFQEYQQFKDILNYLSQQFQDLQCVQSNVVIQQSVNQNQEQNNQFSNSTILQQQNQQSPMKLQLIDNTIEQKDQCHAITFDPTGKIMVSTSGKKIIIWSFDYGMLKQTHIFQEHQDSVSCLIYSQFNNYFISGSLDKSIRMWKYQNNNQWQSSKPYYEHKESITCTILTQQEDQLISSSGDNLIKVWMVDFNNNQLQFQYSLDKHTSKVYSLSLNPSGILLVSCGDNSQIIIWKKKSNKQWNFYYVVNQSIKEIGYHVKFLQEDQFIWVSSESNNLCVFECKDGGIYQEMKKKKIQLRKNIKGYVNEYGFPIYYNKVKNLICIRHVYHIYILKLQNNQMLSIVEEAECQHYNIQGTITNDGQYLVYWEDNKKKYKIYQILYK